jgi:HAE1 family hydrophobic/amphiphilic exporter-1
VQVTTRYPGASARTVIDAVALPIEQQVNGVEGMIYMQSYSAADGTYTLTVTFKIGVDLNVAQILVQNRVSSALSSLPQAVQAQGVVVQKNSTAILQIVTLTSPDQRYDSLYLANFATIKLKDEIARLPGVGNVVVFGAGQYSMRIWLDPDKMRARGLVPQDVIQALQQQSEQVTAGQIGAPPAPSGQSFQYTLNVAGKLSDPAEFAAVIVKTGQAGEITRVRDVATVELGAQTYGQVFSLDGKPSAGLAIFQAPGANALEVAGAVNKKMAALTPEFPPGLVSSIPFDTTKFVQQSIHEVYKTLYEAAILVLIVILVFLQDWRAMLIPATDGAGHHHRRLRRHGRARLHRQLLHPVRDRAGDRHRGGRCHRGGRGRGPQYREGHVRTRGGERRHARAVRADHRHHPGADVGVPPGRLPAGS